LDRSVEDLIQEIEPDNKVQAEHFWADIKAFLPEAVGSTKSHHAWPYGYRDHIRETMNIACVLYERLNRERELPFNLSEALLVMFLHDCEKHATQDQLAKFKWVNERPGKSDKNFQKKLIARYGFKISDEEENALKYVEGEKDDYLEGARVMGPLGALCHASDVISARIWFDQPQNSH
jgi:hypothetical protein